EDADDRHHQEEFDQGKACVPTSSGHGVALREHGPITRQVCAGWLFHRLNLVSRPGCGDGMPTGGAFAAFRGAPRYDCLGGRREPAGPRRSTHRIRRHETVKDSTPIQMAAYLDWLESRHGLRFDDYESLHRWSVTDLDAFWSSIREYFQLIDEGRPEPVLAEDRMPGARWFPELSLNYADQVLRHAGVGDPDRPA